MTESSYHTIVGSLIVKPVKDPIFSEMATTISVEDEAAGEFVRVAQSRAGGGQFVTFDRKEWKLIKEAVDHMFADIAKRENKGEFND